MRASIFGAHLVKQDGLSHKTPTSLCHGHFKSCLVHGQRLHSVPIEEVNMTDETTGVVKSTLFGRVLAFVAGGLPGIIVGMSMSWASPVKNPLMDGLGIFHPFPVSIEEFSWIASLFSLGHLIGSLIGGPVSDLVGRRGTILFAALPNTLSRILITYSTNVAMLQCGNFFAGFFSSGIIASATRMYLNEIAETRIRGAIGVFFVTMITVGILSVFIIGPITTVFGLSMYCSLVSSLLFFVMLFLPESPFHSLKKGNESKARKALILLRGKGYNIEEEISEIKQSLLQAKDGGKISIYEGFQTIEAKRSLCMGFTVVTLEALTGCVVFAVYLNDIFQKIEFDINPNTCVTIAALFSVSGSSLSSLVVDRLGRRTLLMLTGGVNAVSCFSIGLCFILKDAAIPLVQNIYIRIVPVVSVCIYLFAFTVGLAPVEWIYAAEIFPPGIRGPASSICCFGNGLFTFIVNFTYLYMVRSIGTGPTFCIYAFFSLLLFFFARIVLIETKGKSFEQIQSELRHTK